jgi:hypothetical protein
LEDPGTVEERGLGVEVLVGKIAVVFYLSTDSELDILVFDDDRKGLRPFMRRGEGEGAGGCGRGGCGCEDERGGCIYGAHAGRLG